MERYIDLHTHSCKSDGSMEPAQVVREAKKAGLVAIALSDHDTIEGVSEAIEEGKKIGVEVVPAVEFSVKSKTQNHIIALYPDIQNEEFLRFLEDLKKARTARNEETIRLFENLGIHITIDEVKEIAGGKVIGRAHFGKLLVNKGITKNVKESFEKYLDTGGPAYSGSEYPSAEEVVEKIKKAGGLSFMAHLNQTRLPDEELKELLAHLKECGLDGVEGYYTEYTTEMGEKYRGMAKELNLMLSGGSDFHGTMKPHINIGIGTGNLRIPYLVLEKIKEAKENIKL